MVLIIIVCAIAWGVCRFKKVDFLDTLFIGFLIGKQLNILFMRKENNYASNAYMYDSRSYVF